MKILSTALVASAVLLTAHSASAALVGWQTFDAGATSNDINDTTPDNNTTYDATPTGGSAGNVYLTGAIGAGASSLGRDGWGINTNSTFLNGAGFGDEGSDSSRLIENNIMADGTAGTRIGPNGCGSNCATSWKFGNTNNQRAGDFAITNHSDYYFRLEFIHFDARVGNANAPDNLQIVYLAGNGSSVDHDLRRKDTGTELVNLASVYNTDYDPTNSGGAITTNVSNSIGGAISGQAYLAPGASAGFRFLWTGQTAAAAQSQIDNLAFEGTFFETAALTTSIDPASVSAVPVPAAAFLYLSGLAGLAARKRLAE